MPQPPPLLFFWDGGRTERYHYQLTVTLYMNGAINFPPTAWIYRTELTWDELCEDIEKKFLRSTPGIPYKRYRIDRVDALCSVYGDTRITSIQQLQDFLGYDPIDDGPCDHRELVICGPEPWRKIAGGYRRLGHDSMLPGLGKLFAHEDHHAVDLAPSEHLSRRLLFCLNGDKTFPPTYWTYNSRQYRTWEKVCQDIETKFLATRTDKWGRTGIVRALCSVDGGTRIASIQQLHDFIEDNQKYYPLVCVICDQEPWTAIKGGYIHYIRTWVYEPFW